MSAAVLCIGTELTRGELVNSNATWLAERLTALGFELREVATVPDSKPVIEQTLRRLGSNCQIVVCTGGLGPTTDDLTTACAARVLSVPLERDEASLQQIRARFTATGRPMAASNAKQADFPRGARILPNDLGTAPGFEARIGDARVFFLPGVPREMEAMFTTHVVGAVEDLVSEHLYQVRLRTFGLPESAVNDRLTGIERDAGVVIGYRAHFPEIEVKVLARGGDAAEAERQARDAARTVRQRLGEEVVFAEGEVPFAATIGEALTAKGRRLALAESCTGGLVGKLLTDLPGASRYFVGSAVVYSNAAKQRILGVPAELLEQYGAVSAEVARAMADGALNLYGADIGLALTGIAGPDGGTTDKPVGLVHLAIAVGGGTLSREVRFPGSRERVRVLAAYAGLALVRKVLARGTIDGVG
jgi:nicotinamide-nucleotide amidase